MKQIPGKLTGPQLDKSFPCMLWNPKVHYLVHKSLPLLMRRVAANVLNNQPQTAGKRWSFSSGVGRGANNSSPYEMLGRSSDLRGNTHCQNWLRCVTIILFIPSFLQGMSISIMFNVDILKARCFGHTHV